MLKIYLNVIFIKYLKNRNKINILTNKKNNLIIISNKNITIIKVTNNDNDDQDIKSELNISGKNKKNTKKKLFSIINCIFKVNINYNFQ